MGIRMSGLSSGLDTEAIVGALMSAQSLKKTKLTQAKTKLEWTQTKWKELNTKLYKLYSEQVSKLQLQSSYMTKKATASDETKAKITASAKAVNGSYTMEINNIATAQYLTGSKINADKGTTKLVDLDSTLLNKEVEVKVGDKTTKFTVTEDMTIDDFTTELKNAGLNANFDTAQKRLFISSKDSGLANAFSITTSGVSDAEVTARKNLRDAVDYDNMTAANKKIVDDAMKKLETSGVDTTEYQEALDAITGAALSTRTAKTEAAASTYVKAKLYSENYAVYEEKAKESLKSNYFTEDGEVKDELKTKYAEEFNIYTQEEKEKLGVENMTEEEYVNWRANQLYDQEVAKQADTDTTSFVNKQISSDEETKLAVKEAAYAGKTEDEIRALDSKALTKYYGSGNDADPLAISAIEGTSTFGSDSIKNDISGVVSDYASVTDRTYALSGSALAGIGLADIKVDDDGNVTVNGNADGNLPEDMGLVKASDSEILLNGAKMTSSSSTVSVNGLSIELTGLTKTGEPITFSVASDTDAVYNTIKNFFTEYNSLMKEMNELYNADSAKGYEPLTSEQKKDMSDDDIKLWEDKIKASLLRSDTTLGSVRSAMRNAMMSQVTYDGKTYSLASFGISTSSDYTEGGLYHIYGDTEDAVYADKDDKLRKALEEDPDAVVNVLSDIFGKLRSTMSDKMAGSKVSSALTFYSDIKMKDDIKDYEKRIKEWETKLADMEDAYYSKFTKMETALAKLQSQSNSLSGLFGN
ncbi:MAG: flagellar filament capping protein FliD [Eubacterium sp.]|nr:flagellar filament capping protein FliD [Eubacterium sp.]